MPEFEPLTTEDIELANQIASEPLDISSTEALERRLATSLQFLHSAGYITAEKTFVAHNSRDSRRRYTRTAKPLP